MKTINSLSGGNLKLGFLGNDGNLGSAGKAGTNANAIAPKSLKDGNLGILGIGGNLGILGILFIKSAPIPFNLSISFLYIDPIVSAFGIEITKKS